MEVTEFGKKMADPVGRLAHKEILIRRKDKEKKILGWIHILV